MFRIHWRSTPVVWTALLLIGCASHPESDRSPARSRRAASVALPVALSGNSNALASEAAEIESLDSRRLDECLAYGREHSSRLADAVAQWRAAGERPARVGALPEPRVSWTEFLEEVQTRTGPQERRVGISQAFPWPGTLGSRERVAERESDVQAHRVEAVRWAVERDIAVAFWEYGFLARELEITAELSELLRGLEPVVQARVRAGAGQADLLRLQVEIGRLEDHQAALLRKRPALSARLADTMSYAADEPLPLPALEIPTGRALDVAALGEQAFESNPGLRALESELEAHREASNAANKSRFPSFSLGVDWFQTGGAVNPGTAGSGDDPFALTVSMSLPIWTSSYGAAEREARHRARAAQARAETAESELMAAIHDQASRIDDAARQIRLYRDTLIPRASEALRLTLTSYRTGATTLLDLIDSERALLEFELSSWRACRDFLQGEARLRALTGGTVQ